MVGAGINDEEPGRLHSGILSFLLKATGSHKRILRRRNHYLVSILEPLLWLSVEDGWRGKARSLS